MNIMEAFKDFIIKRLPSHFNAVEYADELTPLSENSVLIDFPDVDNMRKDTVIYIINAIEQYLFLYSYFYTTMYLFVTQYL